MLLVVLVAFDVEAVVVTEVHGEDVVRHVGHTVPDDKVGGQPVPVMKRHKIFHICAKHRLTDIWIHHIYVRWLLGITETQGWTAGTNI